MIYPFRFKIGDRIKVDDNCATRGGWTGEVYALELSSTKTIAVVKRSERDGGGLFRVAESQLLAA